MMQSIPVGAPSRFVNLVAWVMIGSALACVLLLLARWLWPSAWVAGGASLTHLWAAGASVAGGVAALGLVLVLGTVACAVGLLMRLDWARKAVMVLLSCWAALWLLVLPLARWAVPQASQGVDAGSLQAWLGMAAWVLPGLCLCALAAWVVRRLRSMGVRREFL